MLRTKYIYLGIIYDFHLKIGCVVGGYTLYCMVVVGVVPAQHAD